MLFLNQIRDTLKRTTNKVMHTLKSGEIDGLRGALLKDLHEDNDKTFKRIKAIKSDVPVGKPKVVGYRVTLANDLEVEVNYINVDTTDFPKMNLRPIMGSKANEKWKVVANHIEKVYGERINWVLIVDKDETPISVAGHVDMTNILAVIKL